ncbi:LarC family nickel insertion protein [Acidobacteriota bacterium]
MYSAWAEKELVTPTGAAILSTLVNKFLPFPEIQYEKIGYGAGGRDLPDLPNILRVFLGNQKEFHPEKTVYQIEANIDDASPQILAAFMEKAFKIGALDVSLTPSYMKKNRLGTKLTILTGEALLDPLIRALFEETPSIGLRYFPVKRRVLERKFQKVRVLDEEITIKIASLEGTPCNIQPEYEDCLRIAKQKDIPLKKIIELALKAVK